MTCEMCGDPAVKFCETLKVNLCKGCCKSYKKFNKEKKELK